MRKLLLSLGILFTVSSFAGAAVADTYRFDSVYYAFSPIYKLKQGESFNSFQEISGPITIKGTGKNNQGSYSAVSLVPGTKNALDLAYYFYDPFNYKKSSKSAEEFIGDSAKYNLITGLVNMLYSDSMSDPLYGAVLQTAIWEVMVDGIDNFNENYGEGNFYISGMTASTTGDKGVSKDYFFNTFNFDTFRAMVKQAYVDALAGNYVRTINDFFVLEGIDGDTTRLAFDFVPAATPIPGVAVLLGSGVAGMLAIRRRMVAA